MDFAAARRMMVDGQVRTADVTDLRLIAAMLELPRERFVPEDKAALAYLDLDVPVTEQPAGAPPAQAHGAGEAGAGRRGQASTIACSMSAAPPAIRRRCWPGSRASVFALEEDAALARHAAQNLASCRRRPADGCHRAADGRAGRRRALRCHPAQRCSRSRARTAGRQLADGGRLVAVLGRAPGRQAMLYRCVRAISSGRPIFDAAAPLLPGFATPPAFVF